MGFVNQVLLGDCLKLMPQLPDQSIDLILSDPPYQMTNNSWDSILPLDQLWKEYRRITKPNAAIILMGAGLFSAQLMLSAPDLYKYTIIWEKNKATNFLNAKKQPLRSHEDILIFYQKQPTYNPQMTTGHKVTKSYKQGPKSSNYGHINPGFQWGGSDKRYPKSIIKIPVLNNDSGLKKHPTQKPVELGEYLIQTFSNSGNLMLDNCAGSGSFLVAAKRLKRDFIGIEINTKFHKIALERLNQLV